MNDHLIITSYLIIDDVMRSLQHRSHLLAKVTDAEVLTVAVVAAKYFHNNHERALWVLTELGYLSERLSTTRFNKGYNSAPDEATIMAETGVRVIPMRRKNMVPHDWANEFDLKRYRKSI